MAIKLSDLQRYAQIDSTKILLELPAPEESKEDLLLETTPIETTAEEVKEEPITPKDAPLTVGQANQKDKGDTFDVQGILSDARSQTIILSDKKTKKIITNYMISSEDNNDWMTICKWGEVAENIKVGDLVVFEDVKVSLDGHEKKYLALMVSLLKTAEN